MGMIAAEKKASILLIEVRSIVVPVRFKHSGVCSWKTVRKQGSTILHFFGYKTEFFPSKILQKSRSVLYDRSRSLGLFRKGKTCIIAKFDRTDLVICCHFREGKPRLIAKEIFSFPKIYCCLAGSKHEAVCVPFLSPGKTGKDYGKLITRIP